MLIEGSLELHGSATRRASSPRRHLVHPRRRPPRGRAPAPRGGRWSRSSPRRATTGARSRRRSPAPAGGPSRASGAAARARQGAARPARALPAPGVGSSASASSSRRALFRLPWLRRFDGYAAWSTILLRERPRPADDDLVCHELCHVWQMQHRPLAMPLSYLRTRLRGEPATRPRRARRSRRPAVSGRRERLSTRRASSGVTNAAAQRDGRLRQRRPGREVAGHLERLARVARRTARAALPRARLRRGALPDQVVAALLELCVEDCARGDRGGRRRPDAPARLLDGRRGRDLGRRRAAASPACSASHPGSPTASTSRRSRGKRLDVLHGSLDRWLPGVPGVSAPLSRRGFERARALGVRGQLHAVRGGVHGLALRAPGGRSCRCRARRGLGAARRGSARDVRRLKPPAARAAASSGTWTFQTRPQPLERRGSPTRRGRPGSGAARGGPRPGRRGGCCASPRRRRAARRASCCATRRASGSRGGRTCGRSSSR